MMMFAALNSRLGAAWNGLHLGFGRMIVFRMVLGSTVVLVAFHSRYSITNRTAFVRLIYVGSSVWAACGFPLASQEYEPITRTSIKDLHNWLILHA